MKICFLLNGIKFQNFSSIGLAYFKIGLGATCVLGTNFKMINKARYATLGRNNRCKITVQDGAILLIGNDVGMSNSTIVSTTSIKLGNNIMIGAGSTIIDSDFHSLNPKHWHTPDDELHMRSEPVVIEDNVFIGMDSIILKGVNIGSNSIIAAGSVLFSNVPENEVWGGNPAKFIKKNN